MPDTLSAASTAWWMLIIHATWQATVVLVLVLLVVRLARRAPAGFRRALLAIALIKLAVPPFAASPPGLFGLVTITASTDALTVTPLSRSKGPPLQAAVARSDPEDRLRNARATDGAPGVRDPSVLRQPHADRAEAPAWMTAALGVHLLGLLLLAALFCRHWFRLRSMRRRATSLTRVEGAERYQTLAARMGCRRPPRLLVSCDLPAPIALGVIRPTIVLPDRLMATVGAAHLDAILAHELAHCRHGDALVNTAMTILLPLWWFHPLTWVLSRALREVQEDWCDDEVIHNRVASDEAYRRVLLRTAVAVRDRERLAFTGALAPARHTLGRRFQRIFDSKTHRGGPSMTTRLVPLLAASLLLPGVRSRADSQPMPVTRPALVDEDAPKKVAHALKQGLLWLASHQTESGVFVSEDEKLGQAAIDQATGLALLAFLGSGNTHLTGPHDAVVKRGLPRLSDRFSAGDSNRCTVNDALAATALAEAFTVSGDTALAPAVRRAVAVVQQRFPADESTALHADPELAFWSTMALSSARDGGLEVDAAALARAALRVATVSDGFDSRWSLEATSAAALFVRLVFGGEDRGDQIKARIDSLQNLAEKKVALTTDLPLLHLGSYALFQVGGKAWVTWKEVAERLLLERQCQQGDQNGSWDAPSGFHGGRIAATALSTLALEVSYRYERMVH